MSQRLAIKTRRQVRTYGGNHGVSVQLQDQHIEASGKRILAKDDSGTFMYFCCDPVGYVIANNLLLP